MNTERAADVECEIRSQQKFSDLLQWLEMQKGGVATFYEFQHRSLALRSQDGQHAGLLRLLADLAGRFADLYDGEPLDLSTANQAVYSLTGYVREATQLKPGEAGELLELMNRIGLAELVPAD
ncbi:hypothetical protein MesoLjLc_07840 [Mesorhizobium sp. L-8-10]|uniref:hypothetical protein n=1 Tax=unclassified Mesorhizobium TaxID=325217 RepID=UPI001925BD12|nr:MULTISPECIES: hypothetical protein [unclassified Mesorhizobium]BCH21011.1 hypothetical protein MesoLjLb_07960 [Mesorhizobium sp. L-8-3]BCH28854.1 hypothetical protein MesoLjLc_07840 [Mesorhizobium sp. L-8-10]